MPDVHAVLVRAVRAALDELGAGPEVEAVVEPSARPEFGDWSSPVALRCARVLRRPAPEIARELRDRLAATSLEVVREWTTSGAYVNAILDERRWVPQVLDDALALDPSRPVSPSTGRPPPAGRTLVEHTAINTNKAAHIGHLRNACIGDAVARILRRTGHDVEVNNYIDDTGAQVADVVVGIRELGIAQREDEPFDQYCSRVYVEVSRRAGDDPALLERRAAVLRDIEARDSPVARYAKELAVRVVRAHLATMRRFDVGYDLLTWESDILELGFWRHAFALLRDSGAITLVTEGPSAGCWVLPAETPAGAGGGGGEDAGESDEKILVKSDGVATYTAKDIAYQLWKFGLLGLDFRYRRWDPAEPGSPATTTAGEGDPAVDPADHGHAGRVVNVIDVRQAYAQEQVRRALERLGHAEAARQSIHLAYEVVALSAAAARELGIEVDGGRGRHAFSGRRGIEVRADDLLDLATARVAERSPDAGTAERLAAGAIRFYLLRFSLSQVIAFDFDDALRVQGDTGVYVEYAHARASALLAAVPDPGGQLTVPPRLEAVERSLLHRIEAYGRTLGEAAATLSPIVLVSYALALAATWNDFYEHTPAVKREADPVVRGFRRALAAAARAVLRDALRTLGMAGLDRV